MDPVKLLLANGYFLSLVLFILLMAMASKNGLQKQNKKINQNIKKIKDQITTTD